MRVLKMFPGRMGASPFVMAHLPWIGCLSTNESWLFLCMHRGLGVFIITKSGSALPVLAMEQTLALKSKYCSRRPAWPVGFTTWVLLDGCIIVDYF